MERKRPHGIANTNPNFYYFARVDFFYVLRFFFLYRVIYIYTVVYSIVYDTEFSRIPTYIRSVSYVTMYVVVFRRKSNFARKWNIERLFYGQFLILPKCKCINKKKLPFSTDEFMFSNVYFTRYTNFGRPFYRLWPVEYLTSSDEIIIRIKIIEINLTSSISV